MTTGHGDPFLDAGHELVGGDPATFGPWQLELLVRLGLDKDSSLLDLGCERPLVKSPLAKSNCSSIFVESCANSNGR